MARLLASDLPGALYGANCLNSYEDIMHYTTIRIKKRERERGKLSRRRVPRSTSRWNFGKEERAREGKAARKRPKRNEATKEKEDERARFRFLVSVLVRFQVCRLSFTILLRSSDVLAVKKSGTGVAGGKENDCARLPASENEQS